MLRRKRPEVREWDKVGDHQCAATPDQKTEKTVDPDLTIGPRQVVVEHSMPNGKICSPIKVL